jgi:hypothetical protein
LLVTPRLLLGLKPLLARRMRVRFLWGTFRNSAEKVYGQSAPPQEFARQLARLRKQTDYPYDSEELSHAAMTKWLAERRARARMPIKVDPDRLAAYVGRYWLPPDRVVTVNREGDRLTIDFPGRTRFSLLPWAEGRFFLKVMDLELTFAPDGKGQVNAVEIDYEGRKLIAKKVD